MFIGLLGHAGEKEILLTEVEYLSTDAHGRSIHEQWRSRTKDKHISLYFILLLFFIVGVYFTFLKIF